MDQIPRMCEILTPAIDALLGDLSGMRRAARERYAQSGPTGGRFGDVLRGWRGQAELIRARLSKEVLATRLACGGQELKDLAKSEYFAELAPDPQKAIGEAILVRQLVNSTSATTGQFTTGVITAGTKLQKTADVLSHAGRAGANYQTTSSVTCGADDTATIDNHDGTWTHFQAVTVPVQADQAGPAANFPLFTVLNLPPTLPVVSSKLFDTFTVGAFQASGGSLGVVDDQIRALARAMSTGSNGPTVAAAVAGALTNPGVRHVAYVDDPALAIGRLFVADESWASSAAYGVQIKRALLARPWIGWGCRVEVFPVQNVGIRVAPAILLRSVDDTLAQDDITANIRTALLEYFDERPDFYTWTLNAIGAVVGGADDRILACTDVAVYDDVGDLLAEPAAVIASGTEAVAHWALVGAGVTPTYSTLGT